jgi:hypothetical protein
MTASGAFVNCKSLLRNLLKTQTYKLTAHQIVRAVGGPGSYTPACPHLQKKQNTRTAKLQNGYIYSEETYETKE